MYKKVVMFSAVLILGCTVYAATLVLAQAQYNIEDHSPKTTQAKEQKFFSDAGKGTKYAKYINEIADLMLSMKVYQRPDTNKFGVNLKTKGDFALQVLAAVSGIGCSADGFGYPGKEACREFLANQGFVLESFPKENLTRAQFYEYLIKARKLVWEEATVKEVSSLCKDVAVSKWTVDLARMFKTARQYGIAEIVGGKCNLFKAFSRKQAALYASHALKAVQIDYWSH